MTKLLHFEDLKVKDCWKSPSRVVSRDDVHGFAELTGDFNPLHVDAEFAKETPFGRPIAHGLLGLSFVAGLSSHYPLMNTAAFLSVSEWKFLKPVYYGDSVHVVTEVIGLEPKGRKRGSVQWRRSLVNSRGEVVQQGKFETLVCCKAVQKSEPAPALRLQSA